MAETGQKATGRVCELKVRCVNLLYQVSGGAARSAIEVRSSVCEYRESV